jgi:mRNA interferase MazF
VPPRRGEVWLFDCGMIEKVRPVFILSIPFTNADRALVTVVFHTTALRNSQFEVKIELPFLKEGAFVAQSIATYPTVRAIRKLGAVNATQLAEVESAVFKWLGRSA